MGPVARLTPAARDLLFGQLAFWAGVIVCIWIRPEGLSANDGISYFGGFANTLVPYVLAFALAAYGLVSAAGYLQDGKRVLKVLRLSLYALAILMAGIIIVPRTLYEPLHIAFGSTIFALQLAIAWLLAFRIYRSWLNTALFALQFLGGVLAAIELVPAEGLLIQSQMVFQFAFGVLLLRSFVHILALDTQPLQESALRQHSHI